MSDSVMMTEDLNEVPLFRGLSRVQFEELFGWVKRRDFSAGDVILKEGQKADGLFIIARGTVEVFRSAGTERISLAKLEGPTALGEMGLMCGGTRSATVVAQNRVVGAFLPSETFKRKIAEQNLTAFRISYNLAKIVSLRMRETLGRISELSEKLAARSQTSATSLEVTMVLNQVCQQATLGQQG